MLDPYELAEELTEDWQVSDNDAALSDWLLLDEGEYVAYVREDVLPDDFVSRHRQWDEPARMRVDHRHPLDRWADDSR